MLGSSFAMWSVITEEAFSLQRFGNMAGVFQVMSYGVGALDNKDVDPPFMTKLAKIATAEIISSKVVWMMNCRFASGNACAS